MEATITRKRIPLLQRQSRATPFPDAEISTLAIDEKRNPSNDRTIESYRRSSAKGFCITTCSKEAACCNEPNPNESEAPQRPQRDKGPNAAEYGDAH